MVDKAVAYKNNSWSQTEIKISIIFFNRRKQLSICLGLLYLRPGHTIGHDGGMTLHVFLLAFTLSSLRQKVTSVSTPIW